MTKEYLLGVFVGILVGLVLMVVILKSIRKDKSIKGRFDERQEIIRGKANRYGFFSLLICNALITLFGPWCSKYLKFQTMIFIAIAISLLVFAGYCIFNDAYINLNEKPKKTIMWFLVIGGINFVCGFAQLNGGNLIENGKTSLGNVNLICGVMMILVSLMIIIKQCIIKKEEE